MYLPSFFIVFYNRARFDMAIDYTLEPVPHLKSEDKILADELLR